MNENKDLKKTENSFLSLLTKSKSQIKLALPKHLDVDRVVRIALTEYRKNPLLAKCDNISTLKCVMESSQLGLEIGGITGQAYLVPFYSSKNKAWECSLIVGYKGLIELIWRSGHVNELHSQCVYANDHFDLAYGIEPKLEHKPLINEDRGQFIGAYAVARFKEGGYMFEFMSADDINRTRDASANYAKSQNKEYTIWAKHYNEMARKTVLRKLAKYLPKSAELSRAVTVDETGDTGDQQIILEGEYFDDVTDSDEVRTDAIAKKIGGDNAAL